MPYMPEDKERYKKPEYANHYEENAIEAHKQYCEVLKPVAKDTNKTRRERIKPTVGQIKR